MVESVLGRAIVEVSEMAGHRRAEIEHIKSFITRQDDGHVRLSYAMSTEPLPRRFIIVASTNNETDLPNDPSGNRRFVPIKMTMNKCGSVAKFLEQCREQLWAEAMGRYRAGVRANLPRSQYRAQRERVEDHRDTDDVVEDAVGKLTTNGPLTMTDVIFLLSTGGKEASQHRVGKALRNAGWHMSRTSAGRMWQRDP